MAGLQDKRVLDHKDHRRELGDNAYVYPVVSRRSGGLSVGVNLNPDKVCNFDCPYCQVDRRIPATTFSVDMPRLLSELDTLLALAESGEIWEHAPFDTVAPAQRTLCDIAFSGDGEPTSYSKFGVLVDAVAEIRDARGFSEVPLVLITNASLFHRPGMMECLSSFHARGGRVWAKLDAGTNAYFQWVCGTKLSLDRIVRNISMVAQKWPITLQSMFLTREGQAAPDEELDAWADRIQELLNEGGQIDLVQVYTVARNPADPSLGALSSEQLELIASRARTLGLRAEIYP